MATLKSLMKTGFGLGLGVMAAQIVFLLIGAAFFIPGFILFTSQKKKTDKNTTEQVSGIVLMGIGALIMGGIGFSYFMDDLGSLFE